MKPATQASFGRRRNSKATAVSLEARSQGQANPTPGEESASSRALAGRHRALELIAKDDDVEFDSPANTPSNRGGTWEAGAGAQERVVKQGRRKGRERTDLGGTANFSADLEDAMSNASTPANSSGNSTTNLLRCKATGHLFNLSNGMKTHQLQSATFLPILESRLSLQATASVPKEKPGLHYFTWDAKMIEYFPLCADFGPFNLGGTHNFCTFLQALLHDEQYESKHLIMYTNTEDSDVTNAIYLLGAFLCLNLGATAEEAWMPFSNIAVNPCVPYCDASWASPSTYDLHVTDCWAGLTKALKMGLYNPAEFNAEEYLYYDDPANGDMHEVVPGKFFAFKGPTEERKPLSHGYFTFLPTDYCAVFEFKGVRSVVRLSEEKAYDREWLVNQGYHHHDIAVPEVATPSDAAVDKFLRIAEASKAPIAVHCETGLGPTPTLIAMYMMKHLDFSADEAIAWLRICRPGAVVGPQQRFLEQQEQHMRSLGLVGVQGLGLEDSLLAPDAPAPAAPDPAALELASALRAAVAARDLAKLRKAHGQPPPSSRRPSASLNPSGRPRDRGPRDDLDDPARAAAAGATAPGAPRPPSSVAAAEGASPARKAADSEARTGSQLEDAGSPGRVTVAEPRFRRAASGERPGSKLSAVRAKLSLMREWSSERSLGQAAAELDWRVRRAGISKSELRASGPAPMSRAREEEAGAGGVRQSMPEAAGLRKEEEAGEEAEGRGWLQQARGVYGDVGRGASLKRMGRGGRQETGGAAGRR